MKEHSQYVFVIGIFLVSDKENDSFRIYFLPLKWNLSRIDHVLCIYIDMYEK